jgi:hypothetical protein
MVRKLAVMLAALALPLVTAVITVAVPAAQPAAAASAPWHNTNPSIAVDRNSNQFVFWRGTDGKLREATANQLSSSGWSLYRLGMGPL